MRFTCPPRSLLILLITPRFNTLVFAEAAQSVVHCIGCCKPGALVQVPLSFGGEPIIMDEDEAEAKSHARAIIFTILKVEKRYSEYFADFTQSACVPLLAISIRLLFERHSIDHNFVLFRIVFIWGLAEEFTIFESDKAFPQHKVAGCVVVRSSGRRWGISRCASSSS